MELLSMNVSLNKVNEVIRIVLKRFAGKEVDQLPSKGLLSQFLIEACHLADMDIGDAILKGLDLESVLGNTIHGDGTTKYHRHYQSFQVTTQEGQSLSVGLLETAGQDAETIFNCWKDRVAEIANATCGSVGSSETPKKTTDQLLVSIKNSMSDQCATNGVFNSLLSELRKDVLPNVIANWKTFTEPEKESSFAKFIPRGGTSICRGIQVRATDQGRFFTSKNPEQAPNFEVLLQNRPCFLKVYSRTGSTF